MDKAYEWCYTDRVVFNSSRKNRSKTGGVSYGACEASFEAKASEESRTDVGTRRVVVIAGGRSIRGNRWAGCGYANEDRTES